MAFYKFDTPNGLSDSSGSHNLTAVNPQFDSTNKISGSSAFEDGTNESYLQFPTSLTDQMYNINNTNGMSFAFWYRLDNASGAWTSLFEFSENASDGAGVRRFGVAKHGSANGFWLGIKYGNDFAQAYTIGSGTFDNNWHHFVCSINTSGTWVIYIDGTLQSSYTTINLPRKIVNTTYNFSYISKSVQSTQTKGNVDNFRIYNRVLPQADVTSLYTKYNTLPPQAYTINFPENTEVQLLVLDNLKYIETAPFTNNGQFTINVGVPSTYNTLTTTTNATPYNSGYGSTITGTSITYNAPVIMVRYKYTRPQIPVVTINGDYRYFSFPQSALDQTLHSMNFQENTEVQLLILNNSYSHHISPFIQTAGKKNVLVGNAGGHSSYGSTSTDTQTVIYNTVNSDITGVNVSYTAGIVIVRYKYTRTQIQAQTIDSNYKYISFPNTGLVQTYYGIDFQEETEVQLLLLDNVNYIAQAPCITNGQPVINAGNPSTFSTLTTNTNATAFNTGYASTITGSSRTYNAPVVIVRYKYTRPQIQAQTIDSNYKYISFPNTGENQTVYSMNFPEATEVQLLLLNDTNMKDITPLTITTGNVDINVGSTGASTFSPLFFTTFFTTLFTTLYFYKFINDSKYIKKD